MKIRRSTWMVPVIVIVKKYKLQQWKQCTVSSVLSIEKWKYWHARSWSRVSESPAGTCQTMARVLKTSVVSNKCFDGMQETRSVIGLNLSLCWREDRSCRQKRMYFLAFPRIILVEFGTSISWGNARLYSALDMNKNTRGERGDWCAPSPQTHVK